MKNRFGLFNAVLMVATLVVCATASASTIRLSEPVLADATKEIFGKVPSVSSMPVSLKTLFDRPGSFLDKTFVLDTKIAKVCQKKGCFFIAKDQHLTMRVSFKDYGFFIPTDSTNKRVQLTGVLVQKEMSPEKLAHYKQDLKSESDELQVGIVYEIVADSITIPKSGLN